MLKKSKKIAVILFVILVCVIFTVMLSISIAGALIAKPSLYVNDDVWYKDNSLRLEKIYEEFFVPVSIFDTFNNISVTVDRVNSTVLVNNSETGSYISFNTKESMAITHENKEMYLKTYNFYHGECYVPVKFVCEIMGLSTELWISPSTSEYSMRICDGSQTLSFEEVLQVYNPSALETTAPPIDSESTVPPDTSSNDTEKRVIYLMFGGINQSTEKIISILNEQEIKSVFFAQKGETEKYFDAVSNLLASGHTLGIYSDISNMEEISEINEKISEFFKFKTRLVMPMSDDSEDLSEEITDNLTKAGYHICIPDVFSNDSGYYSINYVVNYLKEHIMSSSVSLIAMPSDETTVIVLPLLLKFISSNENYTIMQISETDVGK